MTINEWEEANNATVLELLKTVSAMRKLKQDEISVAGKILCLSGGKDQSAYKFLVTQGEQAVRKGDAYEAILCFVYAAAGSAPLDRALEQNVEAALAVLETSKDNAICENEAKFRMFAAGLLCALYDKSHAPLGVAAHVAFRREIAKVAEFDRELADSFSRGGSPFFPSVAAVNSALTEMHRYLKRAESEAQRAATNIKLPDESRGARDSAIQVPMA